MLDDRNANLGCSASTLSLCSPRVKDEALWNVRCLLCVNETLRLRLRRWGENSLPTPRSAPKQRLYSNCVGIDGASLFRLLCLTRTVKKTNKRIQSVWASGWGLLPHVMKSTDLGSSSLLVSKGHHCNTPVWKEGKKRRHQERLFTTSFEIIFDILCTYGWM